MTVKVAVSAEADAVLASLEKIRTAIHRAGQEAVAFEKIDLSHPELQFVAADLKVVQERIEGLHKVGRGDTAAGFRDALHRGGMSPSDFLGRHREWLDRVNQRYPDEGSRNRHIVNFGRNVLGGTSFAPPAPAAPPPPPGPTPPPAPPEGGGGGMLGGMGGSLMGMAKAAGMFMLVQAGIEKVATMATRAIDQAENEALANDTLMRHVRDTGVDFEHLRDAVRETATGLRLTDAEMQRLSLTWVKATNERSSDVVMAGVNTAGGFARGYGMDPGVAVQAFGKAQYLGEDPRKFALMIGDAVNEGKQTGQSEEVMHSLLHWSETASKLIVSGSNLRDYAAMYSGLNATGQPGLKGQNAESLIGQIDNSVRQGGMAGDASMAVTLRALGKRGITDPFQVQYLLDGGMFQKVGEGKNAPTMFDAMREEVNNEYGSLPYYQRLNAMSRMLGINMRQTEALDKFKPGQIGRTEETLKKYNLSMGSIDPSAIGDIAEVTDPHSDLQGMRDRILKRNDVSEDEAKGIKGASGEGLREQLIRFLAEHGQEKTVATRVQQSEADMSNGLTKAATGLVGVIADMKESTAGVADVIGKLSTLLGDWYETMHGKPDRKSGPGDFNPNGSPAGGGDEWGNPLDKDGNKINNFPDNAGQPGVVGAPGRVPPPSSGPRVGNIPTSGEADDRARRAHDYFMSTDMYTEQQTAGLLAGISLESGWDPRSKNKSSGMPGLMNWDTHRRGVFKEYWGHAIDDPNIPTDQLFEEQLRFINYEHNHEEHPAYEKLRETTTAGDAGKSVNHDYLRSNDYGRPDEKVAEKYYQRFGHGTPAPDEAPKDDKPRPGPRRTPQQALPMPPPGTWPVPPNWGADHIGDTGRGKYPAEMMATPEGRAAREAAIKADAESAAAAARKYGPMRQGTPATEEDSPPTDQKWIAPSQKSIDDKPNKNAAQPGVPSVQKGSDNGSGTDGAWKPKKPTPLQDENFERLMKQYGVPPQPLPKDDPGRSTPAGSVNGQYSISPLRVVHEKEDGTPAGEEYLPVTMIPPAGVSGLGAQR
jgi:hypothetical protein